MTHPRIAHTISLDHSHKASKKATVVDTEGKRLKAFKGGLLNIINERNEIVYWVRTMQSDRGTSADLFPIEILPVWLTHGDRRIPHGASKPAHHHGCGVAVSCCSG